MSTAIALQTTVLDLIEEHDRKAAAIEQEIAAFDAAWDKLGMASTVQGTYVESIGSKPCLHASSLRKNLLKSGWKSLYNRLQIGRIASAKDKALFDLLHRCSDRFTSARRTFPARGQSPLQLR